MSDNFGKRYWVGPRFYSNFMSSHWWRWSTFMELLLKSTVSLLDQSLWEKPLYFQQWILVKPAVYSNRPSAGEYSGQQIVQRACCQLQIPSWRPCHYALVFSNTGGFVFAPLYIIRHLTLMVSHMSHMHTAIIYYSELCKSALAKWKAETAEASFYEVIQCK